MGKSFHPMGAKTARANAPAHRLDEFRAGYSSAGWSPPEPASASPTKSSILQTVLPVDRILARNAYGSSVTFLNEATRSGVLIVARQTSALCALRAHLQRGRRLMGDPPHAQLRLRKSREIAGGFGCPVSRLRQIRSRISGSGYYQPKEVTILGR